MQYLHFLGLRAQALASHDATRSFYTSPTVGTFYCSSVGEYCLAFGPLTSLSRRFPALNFHSDLFLTGSGNAQIFDRSHVHVGLGGISR